jgi:hypothetical protein
MTKERESECKSERARRLNLSSSGGGGTELSWSEQVDKVNQRTQQ